MFAVKDVRIRPHAAFAFLILSLTASVNELSVDISCPKILALDTHLVESSGGGKVLI